MSEPVAHPWWLFQQQSKITIETYLHTALPSPEQEPTELSVAMRYAVLNGGKRLRGALVLAVATLFEQATAPLLPLAGALECLHAYSLVHDDLPALDNDTLRRGKLTCHIAFGEATALLVGDALHTFAFELLLQLSLPPPILIALLKHFSQAIGYQGMIGGQMLDIQNHSHQPLSQAALEHIHALKTGALIQASLKMAGLACGLSPNDLTILDRFGQSLGLAFQIQDDILDILNNRHCDQKLGKITYPSLLGLEGAQKAALVTTDEARQVLQGLSRPADLFNELTHYIVDRIC